MHTAAEKACLELLVAGQTRQINRSRCIRDGHCAGHKTAVIAPVEAKPRTTLPRLILEVCGLVEPLVVVDAERGERVPDRSRRNSAGSADLGSEEARGNTGEDHERRESMEVRHAHASGKSWNLGVVPFDRKRNGSASQHAEIVSIVGIFPDKFAGEHYVLPESLLQASVEFIAPSRAERSDLARRRTAKQ